MRVITKQIKNYTHLFNFTHLLQIVSFAQCLLATFACSSLQHQRKFALKLLNIYVYVHNYAYIQAFIFHCARTFTVMSVYISNDIFAFLQKF